MYASELQNHECTRSAERGTVNSFSKDKELGIKRGRTEFPKRSRTLSVNLSSAVRLRFRDFNSVSGREADCGIYVCRHCDIANASRVQNVAVDALQNYENSEQRLEFPSAYGSVRNGAT